MEAKYIQGTPEYREWILSQLPPGVDPATLGIPGLVIDTGAPPKLGDLAKVSVPTSLSSLLMHGALSSDGARVFTVSDVAIDEVSVAERKVLRTVVASPVNDFGETEPLRFRFCALCAEDSLLATASWEGEVRVYRTSDGALVAQAKATANGTPVTALEVFPDGARFAVVANSGEARVFEATSGEEVWGKQDAHDTWIQAACVSTSGDVLYTGDSEGLIKAWGSSDGAFAFEKTVHAGLGVTAMRCLPDGRLLIGYAEGKLYICSADDCSIQTKKLVSDSDVRWISHSRDLSTLFTSANDHALRAWRMEDMHLLRDLQGQAGYASFHAMVPGEDTLIAVTSNTVDIHTMYPWTQWLERSLVSDGIEDAEEMERDLRLKMDGIRALKQRAQELLDTVLAEPLDVEPAALERMAVDNSEKEAKLVFKTADEAVEQAEAGIHESKQTAKVIADAMQLDGAELLALKQEMFAADSDRFDNAARQAVRELKQAAEKCATATEAIAASLAKLEGAPEMRKRASEGAKIHAARVAARAERLNNWPHDDKLPALENGCKWHFFLSHFQLNGGDQCMALRQSLMEVHPEIKVWYDQVNTPTEAGMKEGVSGSETFLVFLTSGVLTRYFVQLEVRTALALGKPVVLVHETDPRHGYAPIGDLIAEAPEDIRVIFNDSVAVPHYREHEYRKVMLAKILRNAALPIPKQMNLGGGGGSDKTVPVATDADADAEAVEASETSAAPASQPVLQAHASPAALSSEYSDSVAQLSAVVSSLQDQISALSSANRPAATSSDPSGGSAALLTRLEALEARVASVHATNGGLRSSSTAEVDPVDLEKLREQVEDLRKRQTSTVASAASGGNGVTPLSDSEAAAALEKKMNEQAKAHALELQRLNAELAVERAEREKLAKSMAELMNGLDRVGRGGPPPSSSSCNLM